MSRLSGPKNHLGHDFVFLKNWFVRGGINGFKLVWSTFQYSSIDNINSMQIIPKRLSKMRSLGRSIQFSICILFFAQTIRYLNLDNPQFYHSHNHSNITGISIDVYLYSRSSNNAIFGSKNLSCYWIFAILGLTAKVLWLEYQIILYLGKQCWRPRN